MDLSVVCWRWRPVPGYRSVYGPGTVNTLQQMVARHCAMPHRFLCITDDTKGLHSSVEAIPMLTDFATVPSPHGARNPSCYRRLRMFAPEFEAIAGRRFVALDLDCILTADVTPLWDRAEDFVAWGDTSPRTLYNGSMVLMTAGSRRQVWDRFDPKASPKQALKAGYWGSDQGWISYCLGKGERIWGTADGVYSFRNHIKPKSGKLPTDARMVIFHGHEDPWSPAAQRLPWVKAHYQ